MLRNKYQMKRRQKPAAQPVFRIENETNPEDASQYFQVTVNVVEARKLAWANPHTANSYVLVVIGKKKQRTNIKRNMEEPHYKECFVFELHMSIRNIKRMNVWLAVMEPKCCAPTRLLGETNIDLGTIWLQPYHQVFHKWAQLNLSRNPAAGIVGFLKVDISIICKGCMQIMHSIENDGRVEENLLFPYGSEQQRANYLITIYGGFGLTYSSIGDRNYGKPPSTFVRVTFCGLTVTTAIQQRNYNPIFCERVSIVEMFPNMSQLVYLELCSSDSSLNKVIGSFHLNLSQISHDGDNGFIPTFGPSLIHMYGASSPCTQSFNIDNGAFHRGALLVSLKTIVPYYQQSTRTTSVEPVVPIKLESLWTLEDFCIFSPILEVSMLDRRVFGKYCGVAITIAEMPKEQVGDDKFISMMSEIRSRKLHYTGSVDVIKTPTVYGYVHFENYFPILQLATRLPDFRFRLYRNNMIYGIAADLEHTLNNVEIRLKNLEYSAPNELVDELNKEIEKTVEKILKFFDVIQCSDKTATDYDEAMNNYSTELDQKQLSLQKEEIEKIYLRISKKSQWDLSVKIAESTTTNKNNNVTRKYVKLLLAETKSVVQNLKHLIFKTSECWPDIVVWLLNSGSRVAYARVSPSDVIYSVIPEQCGRRCGRIQTVYMKPLKCLKQIHSPNTGCFCIVGKIELSIWMGSYKQLAAFETFLPNGYKLKINDCVMSLKATTMMLECRVFIYRAKLMNIIDSSSLNYTFIRVNTFNTVKESKARQKTSTPIWNQVLRINKIVYSSEERIMHSPPDVLVEVCDSDLSSKTELIGRVNIQPVVDDRRDYEFAPKLQWYELYKGLEYAGRLLMSVQILQIPETLLRTTNYGPVEDTYYVADFQEQSVDNIESLPESLIPHFTTYKLDIYWWGLRDVNITRKPGVLLEIEELSVKSDIIIDKKPNCNFPNGRTTHIFDAPLEEAYSPPLTIKLYDQSTFGRTLFLGTNVVKNPNKYIVYWYSRNERELTLKRSSIKSAKSNEVTPLHTTKNSKEYNEKKNENRNQVSDKKIVVSKAKRSAWKKLFWRRKPDEEEFILLPIFTTKENQTKNVTNVSRKHKDSDWWMRYFSSQKDTEDNNPAEDRIMIYNSELETQQQFSKFKDWCTTFKLYNGNKTGIPEKDESLYCGCLKAGIAIYKWPPALNTIAVSPSGVDLSKGYFNSHSTNYPAKFLVRVYIIKALDLIPKDFTGKLDPYTVISCGNKRMGDRNFYITNSVNPVFGKMYDFRCTLPEDYLLTVSLFNYDAMSADELIGSTAIDLEDRIYTKHRARVGLPLFYNSTGSAKWRDYLKPSIILEELCTSNHIPPPIYPNMNTVILNGVEYKDNERCNKSYTSPSDIKENICLGLLHKWHTLPICGYHLVPEHVETRSLYNPEKRRVEQGKIQMWVDIFPLDNGLYVPMPIDITPRKMEDYELRLIIWNVRVLRYHNNDLREMKHADIYVKAWIGSEQAAQYTDVHHRSKTGEASFNWRMVFHFQYQHAAGKLVKKEKGPFIEFDELAAPIVVVQVLEATQDDFIACLAFNLNTMSEGTDSTQQCSAECERMKKINLFSTKSVRARWPLFAPDRQTGLNVNAGIIDLEMTLLPANKAIFLPVGLGRDPPQPLPQPHRSELKVSKQCPLLECLFRYGRLEYTIFGIILFITFTVLCLYLEIPRTVLDYIFD